MHTLREFHASGRIRLELARLPLAKSLICAAALLACDNKKQMPEPASEHGITPENQSLHLATHPNWQLVTIDSLGLSLRKPKDTPLDLRGASSRCLASNQQPLLFAGEGNTFVPVFFSTGSLGEALQSVSIGYDAEEKRYVSYGRMGATDVLDTYRGTRSIIFSGGRMVGVPLSEEGGGMALDEVQLLTAVVRRPDGCWIIFTFDEYAEDLEINVLWHILETVRFNGEDVNRALPGQRFAGQFDFSARLRKVVTDSAGMTCLQAPPASLPAGTPVTVLRNWGGNVEAVELAVPDTPLPCPYPQAIELRPGFDEQSPVLGFEGIGLIAPTSVSFKADSLVMDLDGNGIPEHLESCRAGDSTEDRIVERSPAQNKVRFRQRSAERVDYASCRN
jgi:hypothetical protein